MSAILSVNFGRLETAAQDRNQTIALLKELLKQRTGTSWSVRGGKGTAWGWIKIESMPARQTWRSRLKEGAMSNAPENFERYDSGMPGGSMSPDDIAALSDALGKRVHCQGESVAASTQHRLEVLQRAAGVQVTAKPEQYWD